MEVMRMQTKYRVRQSNVQVCDKDGCWDEQLFLAERSVTLLGVHLFWWSVKDATWRATEDEARGDVSIDKAWRHFYL